MSKQRRGRRRPMVNRCPGCNAPIGLNRKTKHVPGCLLDAPEPLELSNCPDCDGPFTGGELQHEECCPFYAGQEATADDDRRWFEAHPGETVRVRPPFHSEQMENSHANTAEPNSWVTHVVVTQLRPGTRWRSMHTVMLVVIRP